MNAVIDKTDNLKLQKPDISVSVRRVFGIDIDMDVPRSRTRFARAGRRRAIDSITTPR